MHICHYSAKFFFGNVRWNAKAYGHNRLHNQTIDLEDYASLIDEDNNSLTLYAKWIAAEQNVTMQTFDDTVEPYASATEDTVIALKDERDHDVYAVAKLADGNWWMIENLRIDGSVDEQTMATKSQGVGGQFTKLPSSTDTFQDTFNETYPESLGLSRYTLPQIRTNNTVFEKQNQNSKYAYGNYYSWAAAIADTTEYTSNTVVENSSICPLGWHLITASSDRNIDRALGGTGGYQPTSEFAHLWRAYPINAVFNTDSYNSIEYWKNRSGSSSFIIPDASAWHTHIGANSYSQWTESLKSIVLPVRCIAD